MKKFLGTRFGVIVITMVVCMVLFSSVAFGAGVFDKPLPATANIKASAPGLTFYSDSGCTQVITSLTWNNITSGEPFNDSNIWVKNTGNKTFTSVSVTSNLDPAIGTITSTPIGSLAKNAYVNIILTLITPMLDEDVSPTFDITFSGSY